MAHPKNDGDNKGPGGGKRALHVRVKTAKKRSVSSARWLERQLNDPYVVAAHRDGYRSRAAYKLKELDERHHLLKPGMRIINTAVWPSPSEAGAFSSVTDSQGGINCRRASGVWCHSKTALALAAISEVFTKMAI